jgi:hypothetical protein
MSPQVETQRVQKGMRHELYAIVCRCHPRQLHHINADENPHELQIVELYMESTLIVSQIPSAFPDSTADL